MPFAVPCRQISPDAALPITEQSAPYHDPGHGVAADLHALLEGRCGHCI